MSLIGLVLCMYIPFSMDDMAPLTLFKVSLLAMNIFKVSLSGNRYMDDMALFKVSLLGNEYFEGLWIFWRSLCSATSVWMTRRSLRSLHLAMNIFKVSLFSNKYIDDMTLLRSLDAATSVWMTWHPLRSLYLAMNIFKVSLFGNVCMYDMVPMTQRSLYSFKIPLSGVFPCMRICLLGIFACLNICTTYIYSIYHVSRFYMCTYVLYIIYDKRYIICNI